MSFDSHDKSVSFEDCIEYMSSHSSGFYDSSEVHLHQQEIITISHNDDGHMGLPKANTNDLGIRDALYVEDTCCEESDFSNQTLENKLEDSFVGMEFQVCVLDGHVVTLEA